MRSPTVTVYRDPDAVAAASGAALLTAIAAAQQARGHAQVCLTGGSMGSAILAAAGRDEALDSVDWSAVRLWWGDERYLPDGDPERNDTQNGAALLDRLISSGRLPEAHVHRVLGPDATGSAQQSAQDYAQRLREHGTGQFDVVLLGMGPDGHVASLFPHHPAQRIRDEIAVAVNDSPKPPPTRVSLTFECLERTREVWLLVAGAEKAAVTAQAMAPDTDRWDVPAAGVRGREATRWWLDEAAARDVTTG